MSTEQPQTLHASSTTTPASGKAKKPKLTLKQVQERERKKYLTAKAKAGRPVATVRQLILLAELKQSVFIEGALGLKPAAWVINLPCKMVHNWIMKKSIQRYTK
jgi:hypothetical protein